MNLLVAFLVLTFFLLLFFAPIPDQVLKLVDVFSEPLAFVFQAVDVSVVSGVLGLKVIDLFFETGQLTLLLVLGLLQLLKVIDLIFESFLSLVGLLTALLDAVGEVLHLALEVLVDVVLLFHRLVVSVDQGFTVLSALLQAAKLIKALFELSALLSPLLNLLVKLVTLAGKVLLSGRGDVIVRVVQQVHLQLQGGVEVLQAQLGLDPLALSLAQL